MNGDSQLAEIRRRLIRPESVADVLDQLPGLDELARTPDAAKEAEDLQIRAFVCMRELTATEPERAVEIITQSLLPRCLVPDAEAYNAYGNSYSSALGEWLDDLSEEYVRRIRAVALPRAVVALGKDGTRNAIRLISSIGYWDDSILSALDQLAASREDDTGDHAQAASVGLCSPSRPPDRTWHLGRLHRRLPCGPNFHQISCCRVIGTIDTAERIWTHWISPPMSPAKENRFYNRFACSLIAEIADRERDAEFTAMVWDRFVELSRQRGSGSDDVFAPNSSIVNHLDVPSAVPTLLSFALQAEGTHRYTYYTRALECERLAHMTGWDAVPDDVIAHIREDAVRPTGMTGRFATFPFNLKETSWNVLLCHGVAADLPLLGDALVSERGHVIHRFLELAACLGLDALPRCVKGLLTGSLGTTVWDDQERLIAQIGAIEAARGAATHEAFSWLLGYRRIGEGVLVSVVEALAETALILNEAGDRSPILQLLSIAESSSSEDSRGAATAAVAEILNEGALTDAEASRAAMLLHSSSTDPYARRELLFSFTTHPTEHVPPSVFEYAQRSLSIVPEDENRDVRSAALAILGHQAGARSDTEFLTCQLGLIKQVGAWTASPSTTKGVRPHVVGRYFVQESDRFAPAVAAIIRDGDAGALAHLLHSVREAGVIGRFKTSH